MEKTTTNFLNEKITPNFYLKNISNSNMKYFTPKFYFKKVTPYSEKIICKTKNFTPKNKTFTLNLIFFTKPEKF